MEGGRGRERRERKTDSGSLERTVYNLSATDPSSFKVWKEILF